MVKLFEGLPLFPSTTVLVATGLALSYCARAHGVAGRAGEVATYARERIAALPTASPTATATPTTTAAASSARTA